MKGRLENELKHKEYINNILKTLPKCVTEYYYNLQSYSEIRTCREYISCLRRFFNYYNGEIDQIKSFHLGQYLEKISYTEKQGELKKTSSSYRQMNWSALKSFFTYLYETNFIKDNPMKNIKRPKSTDVVEHKILTMDNLNSIVNAVKTGAGNSLSISRQESWKERDMLILAIFMFTGMRCTALSEINISDISFTEKKITVVDKRNKTHEYIITPDLENMINKWLVVREQKMKDAPTTDALFISMKRNRLSSHSIFNIIKKYSNEALGNGGISPHKLRGAFITNFYEASGHDIERTRIAVGHSSIQTTARYIAGDNTARNDAINYMSNNLDFGV